MTPHKTPKEDAAADEKDICPHCGSVLDVSRAIQDDRSILDLRRRATRREPRAALAPDTSSQDAT